MPAVSNAAPPFATRSAWHGQAAWKCIGARGATPALMSRSSRQLLLWSLHTLTGSLLRKLVAEGWLCP